MTDTLPALAPSAHLAGTRAKWDAPADGTGTHGARLSLTRTLARLILEAPLRTRVGDLTVYTGGWSRERGQYADSVGEAGSPEWIAALGTHERATLTSDGRAANREQWCQCGEPASDAEWVRYEHWTAAGRVAHGFVHSECRRLLQTG